MPRKETMRKEGRKNGSGQKVKPSTTTQAIDAHMGEEEKYRRKNKRKTGSRPPNPACDPYESYVGLSRGGQLS